MLRWARGTATCMKADKSCARVTKQDFSHVGVARNANVVANGCKKFGWHDVVETAPRHPARTKQVVGTAFKASKQVALAAARRLHRNGQRMKSVVLTQLAIQFRPAHARHHHIENDEIGLAATDRVNGLITIARRYPGTVQPWRPGECLMGTPRSPKPQPRLSLP